MLLGSHTRNPNLGTLGEESGSQRGFGGTNRMFRRAFEGKRVVQSWSSSNMVTKQDAR
jgi:hypothetical protein